MDMKYIALNRRARFDYDILETVEAGLVLSGQEVKSCRLGHADLRGSYVSFQYGIPVLKQSTVSPYPAAGPLRDYDPHQDRRLLLKQSECERLQRESEQKGATIIPLSLTAGRWIKVQLALARGRKTIDKRQKIKERDVERRMRREGN